MRRKISAFISAFLIVLLIVAAAGFAGCQKKESIAQENTNNAENADDSEEADEVDPKVEYAYRDIICDRSLTEGKMACYFFRSNYMRPRPNAVSLSGDATLLIAPDGTTMLIDTNLPSVGGRLVDYLNRLGISKLDYVMLSHTDLDHIGGLDVLMNYMDIGQILINEAPNYSQITGRAGRSIAAAQEKGITITRLHAGMNLDFGGVHMETLWPAADFSWTPPDNSASTTATTINSGSLVVKFTYKKASFLFAGDIYVKQEDELLDQYGEAIQADIVKMSHHGLTTSNGERWIVGTKAKLFCGMVSTIKETEVLMRYMYHDIPFTYSILDGTALVYTSGDGVYDVQVEKERDNDYFGMLDTKNGHFQIK